ncbi:hypothetical protein EST62_12295 [Chlorobaculum sp. 24CR]|uniref:hypothetical protein n=1 Tax=Chlorobaculum sp. 24CR TaxID=2508878 RepID=UPI00100A8BD7|nr:hypothetical protein [Chlorobaculum sp. 24CR]RXK81067.1 hypothetical protein EST62_12295 [Chlorobaculum sp. 24CR]
MAYPFIKGSDGRVFKYAVNYKSEVGRGAEWYKEYYEYFEKLFGGGVPISEFVALWRGDAK